MIENEEKKGIKIVSILLSLVLTIAAVPLVNAAEITSNGSSGSSVVTLTSNSTNMRVTVPSVLPILVDSDNNVTVATNAKIANESAAPVEVTQVSVVGDNGWNLVPFDTDFTKVPVDTKQYGMTMMGADVCNGVDALLFDQIEGGTELGVIYNGNVAIQSSDSNKLDIGHVIFTVGWKAVEDRSVVFNAVNADAAAYMASPDYDMSDRSYTYVPDEFTVERPDRPAVGTLSLPDGATTVTLINNSRGIEWTDSVAGKTEYKIKNLIPNEQYQYVIKNAQGEIIQQDYTQAYGRLRMIDGGNRTENIRDLGGIQASGGTLYYNKIYRGAQLVNLTSQQQDYFKDFLGVDVDLDLRSSENDARCEPAFSNGIEYINNPGSTGFNSVNVTLSWNLNEVAIVRSIINNLENGKCTYIHCQAGADRTQIAMMLVLALCGVSDSDIEKEYELSSFSSANRRRNLTTNVTEAYLKAVERMDYYMGNTLHEKAVSWALKSGITIDEINSLRNHLINGNPQNLVESNYTYYNVLNRNSLTFDTVVDSSSGNLVTKPNYGCTDFIAVDSKFLNTELEVITDTLQSDTYAMLVEYYDSDKTTITNSNKYDVTYEELPNGLYRYRYPLWKYMGTRDYTEVNKPWLRLNFKYIDSDNVTVSVVKR